MENSKIEWTDHTFNPWIGCAKVSSGCQNCYAETLMDTRYGRVKWGKDQPRSRTSASNWKKPEAWNREAAALGIRPRVFCASLADWLDDEVPIEWLADLLDLIRRTPNLDWLLLTKRPENFFRRLWDVTSYFSTGKADFQMANWVGDWTHHKFKAAPANVWIGTTVENQAMADLRVPQLLQIPVRVRFLSCEPLLGAVDLFAACFNDKIEPGEEKIVFGTNHHNLRFGVDWVICGGESGPGARPMHPDWARSLRDQCQAASVPFLFKQWGHYDELGRRAGKAEAGRLLDGREWNEVPCA